jgi:excisionase family DNA binding protein
MMIQLRQTTLQLPTERSFEHHVGRSVSIEQAAILLGVCRRTVYNRIRDGSLETVRTLGTSQRVLVSSIDEHRKVIWGASRGIRLPESEPVQATNVVPFEPRRLSF